MRRIHFIELEDQKWCPCFIRDGITDFLQWLENTGHIYRPIYRRFNRVLNELKPEQIVDLCSGGGGPCIHLFSELDYIKENGSSLCLTDLYPNRKALERLNDNSAKRISYHSDPVDATNVPHRLVGFRTLFTSFHHFAPREAQSIIRDAVNKRQGIGIFEFTQRNSLTILIMMLAPVVVLLATPFIRPLRMPRLFWTYVLPVVPFAIMYDGIISCLRTYTPEELRDMALDIPGAKSYCWKYGLQPTGIPFCKITYLMGYLMSNKQDVSDAAAADPSPRLTPLREGR